MTSNFRVPADHAFLVPQHVELTAEQQLEEKVVDQLLISIRADWQKCIGGSSPAGGFPAWITKWKGDHGENALRRNFETVARECLLEKHQIQPPRFTLQPLHRPETPFILHDGRQGYRMLVRLEFGRHLEVSKSGTSSLRCDTHQRELILPVTLKVRGGRTRRARKSPGALRSDTHF
jgi:hypothetical protein